jgi:hypothetical protein
LTEPGDVTVKDREADEEEEEAAAEAGPGADDEDEDEDDWAGAEAADTGAARSGELSLAPLDPGAGAPSFGAK